MKAVEFFESLPSYDNGCKILECFGDYSLVGYKRADGMRVTARIREQDWAGVELTDDHKQVLLLFLAAKKATN